MKFINAFFCDDIRFEANNKLSLMGLYSDSMVCSQHIKLPIPARLAILLKFTLEKDDTKPRYFEFKYFLRDKELMSVNGEMQPNISNNNMQLVINAEGLMLETGELGYSIALLDDKKNNLLVKKDMHALKIMTE